MKTIAGIHFFFTKTNLIGMKKKERRRRVWGSVRLFCWFNFARGMKA
jgi:hypothetical protein